MPLAAKNIRLETMILLRVLLILTLLGAGARNGWAEDLYRRKIAIAGADGHEVIINIPVGVKVDFAAKAVHVEADGTRYRLSGDAVVSAVDSGRALFTVTGSEMVLTRRPTLSDEAGAVADLESMRASDQLFRGNNRELTPGEWQKQNSIDDANMERLRVIIDKFGWPGFEFAGVPGSRAAFLVLQHARDVDVQEKYLPALRYAVSKKDASAADLAFLEDRVRLRRGRPQLYGTQLEQQDPPIPAEIENAEEVDARRLSVGLPPLAEYLESFKK